jgi:hypothetical protein
LTHSPPASSSHGSDPPTDPDEAWRLASEGGRELKVGRELRCHAVHRELISSVDPSLENPLQVPAFTPFGLAAVPGPPGHFELEPRFLGLDGAGAVLDAGAAFFGKSSHQP